MEQAGVVAVDLKTPSGVLLEGGAVSNDPEVCVVKHWTS